MRSIIVAYDREHAIGANGDLLWKQGEMRGDMSHFRERTMGSILIMGRKTLDSIGVALPGRKTIMLTHGDDCLIPGVDTVRSLEEAYLLAGRYEKSYARSLKTEQPEGGLDQFTGIFVVGGGEIYKQALKDVDRVYATEIDVSIPGADTFFPKLGNIWERTDFERHPADENNKYPYNFVTYERDKR